MAFLMPPLPSPAADSTVLSELCQRLVPGGIPKTVKVDAPPWAKPLECVPNIEKVIALHGGDIVYGWNLIESLKGVMIEAEFHALWISDEGLLLDVTPKQIPAMDPVTVFLSDPELSYEGQQIDNVRVALRDDQLIHSYIRTAEARFEAWNRGDLAQYHGDMRGRITPEMQRIEERLARFQERIMQKYYGS
ncbi:MAG: hypothetical protein M3Y75_06315 [Actinomycetota bacterium]|nr:hypothetical protein [Actinomycetota bacterium]